MGHERPDPLEQQIERLSGLILSEDGERGLLPRMERTETLVEAIEKRVTTLEKEPARKWTRWGVMAAIAAAAFAALTYFAKGKP